MPRTVASSCSTVRCSRSGCCAACQSRTSIRVCASLAAGTDGRAAAVGTSRAIRSRAGPACSSARRRSSTVSASPIRLGGQPNAESTLDAQDQFGPAQAVDAEIALDTAGRQDVDEPDALRMKLAHKLPHERDQVALAKLLLGNRGSRFSPIEPLVH